MDTKEIRRTNLRLLVKKYGGQKALAEAADLAPNQLSHIIGPNPIRNLGETLARKIEVNLGLEKDYLDKNHKGQNASKIPSVDSSFIPNVSIRIDNDRDYILTVEGDGAFRKQWASGGGLEPEHLFQFEMPSDNMDPSILKNDFLIIDSSRKEIKDSKIYLLMINDTLTVRRMFYLLADEIKIANDNPNKILYPDMVTKIDSLSQINIIGQVVAIQRNLPL